MKVSPILALIVAACALSLPACERMQAGENEQGHEDHHEIVLTSPASRDVVITQPYVCQIRSQQHIEVCALQDGYLQEILVREGQAVKKGEVMFKILPTLYKARFEAEQAEAQLAQIEYEQTKKLSMSTPPVVSPIEVSLAQAKLNKANAKMNLAAAEMKFTEYTAPFDGIVDRLQKQLGSLIEKKDVLTTLSDNSLMWVYFNVPESRYLEYMEGLGQVTSGQRIELPDSRIELVLANGNKFKYSPGNSVTVEGKFNNETGNIAFRADFPNPYGLLRHGQTGTVLIQRSVKNAVVIPQRAAFEILDKQYVWVVGEDHVAHLRQITIQHELEDIYVIRSGIDVKDKIVLEGVRQVKDKQKLGEVEFQKPEEALKHQKYHAE